MADEPENNSETETPRDLLLDQEVERALAPYRGVVSLELLAHFEKRLREALLLHPVGRRFLNRTRPTPELVKSGETVDRVENKPATAAAVVPFRRVKGGG